MTGGPLSDDGPDDAVRSPADMHATRRQELVAMLSDEGRFDFESAEEAWGGTE